MAARLFDETIDHRQAESRSLALALGREEGLEDLVDDVVRHTAAGVGHGQHDILARCHLVMGAGIIVVEMRVAQLDGQLALAIHRIAGVDRQVQQRILDLRWVDEGVPEATPTIVSISTPSPIARRSISSMPWTKRVTLTTLGSSA